MSESQNTQLFNRNSVTDVDDSDLINSYDRQYEKVKKKAKAKLPPIDSMSELSLNDKESGESSVKTRPKKKTNTNKNYQTESTNRFEGTEVLFPPPPPPPDSIKNLPKTEREALTSMLMSYYMSGFHTGYYLGMKQNNSEN
ncbi:survival of motor neuron protein-like [Aphis craccivora]|uniref:Survival of motor neuron protein-like n=1 Tax=Aphis craccivora TaxID=307492 RepID=A0A6G0YJI2_APHCR|nr:survival of motor neuron protein-like [Aphis craccivora]